MSAEKIVYIPNAGQTYMPFKENINVPLMDYTPLPRPEPPIPEPELTDEAIAAGIVLNPGSQHFLPGVTPEMMDWFWVNMEKCYYLWAPGSHKRFNWVKSPAEVGFLNSAHMISESIGPGIPVFGGNGIEIRRMSLDNFPLKHCLSHAIMEGVFNSKNELIDSTIHMWEAAPGGTNHITLSVVNTRATEPPEFVKEALAAGEQPQSAGGEAMNAHAEYEASRWPVFLPTLYNLWKDHPDPSQNVKCDLTVKNIQGKWAYAAENGPVVI